MGTSRHPIPIYVRTINNQLPRNGTKATHLDRYCPGRHAKRFKRPKRQKICARCGADRPLHPAAWSGARGRNEPFQNQNLITYPSGNSNLEKRQNSPITSSPIQSFEKTVIQRSRIWPASRGRTSGRDLRLGRQIEFKGDTLRPEIGCSISFHLWIH